MSIQQHYQLYIQYLEANGFNGTPRNLYDSMDYIMQLKGKRIRPILCLMGAESVGGDPQESLILAHAFEIFHNFSLVHDDIMDQAAMRRGMPTVHIKYNQSTAILAGDNMLIKAYQYLHAYNGPNKARIIEIFSAIAIKVCEGQQADMNYSTQEDVGEDEYLQMIENKTAILLGACLACGALSANASEYIANKLQAFAICVGLSFQLLDDYLDTFGESVAVGKVIGGDIMEGKKTWLYIKSCEANKETKNWYLTTSGTNRVALVKQHWIKLGLDKALLKKRATYDQLGITLLEELESLGVSSNNLKELVTYLSDRTQ